MWRGGTKGFTWHKWVYPEFFFLCGQPRSSIYLLILSISKCVQVFIWIGYPKALSSALFCYLFPIESLDGYSILVHVKGLTVKCPLLFAFFIFYIHFIDLHNPLTSPFTIWKPTIKVNTFTFTELRVQYNAVLVEEFGKLRVVGSWLCGKFSSENYRFYEVYSRIIFWWMLMLTWQMSIMLYFFSLLLLSFHLYLLSLTHKSHSICQHCRLHHFISYRIRVCVAFTIMLMLLMLL